MSAPGTRNSAPGAAEFVVSLVGWDRMDSCREEWKRLSRRAVEPNVFYDPDFALPAGAGLGLSGDLLALLVWREAGHGSGSETRTLAGFFPFVPKRRWGVPMTVGEALIHPYAMSSAPLVDAAAVDDVLRAFLGWLNMARQAPAAWLFGFLPGDGTLHDRLWAMAERSDMAARPYDGHERAVLDTGSLSGDYLGDALSGKARKEYGRLRRRLGDHGNVTVTRATARSDVDAAMAEFLSLEASGWKGQRGTAAALSAPVEAMFGDIGRGLGGGGEIRIDALRVDGRPIAMTVSCGRAESWWLWKIAYDEGFAAFSPGVLLVLHLTQNALNANVRVRYDSCALPGHPMIDRIWRQRRPYADLLLVPGRSRMKRGLAVRLESLRRTAEQRARDLRAFAARD
ncbi:GNAT family N-acetyltransferase [Microbaculum marinum]|uniref:GNAT family N-acetyltransferase n=1 Tax=Microbaculum marinum TaxID=1764581 RepID=A0AAW9RAF2_9HYPH